MTEKRKGGKKRFLDVLRRPQSSTPAQAPRPATPASTSNGSNPLTHLLPWSRSSPTLQIPRSRSLSSIRGKSTSQEVGPQAHSLLEHSNTLLPAGTPGSDALSSGDDQPANSGDPRSRSPPSSSTRRASTSRAVRPQADSLLEHSDVHWEAGTSDFDALSSTSKPADPSPSVKSTAAGMTGLAVFKRVLEVTEGVAEVFPPLKLAVGGLLGILDWVETVVDVHEKLKSIAEKVSFMTTILKKYQSLPSDSQAEMRECAKKVADMIDRVTNVVREKRERYIITRIALAPADVDEVERQLRVVGDATDLFLMLVSVRQIEGLGELRTLNQSSDAKLDNLVQLALMQRLDPIVSAHHDAMHIPSCTEKTRIQLLDDIYTWALADARPIFILNGAAGTGKSTVAKTVCAALEGKSRLGGSFFCSRGGKAGQQDVESIFHTLAYFLSHYSPTFAAEVAKALQDAPDVAKFVIKKQFDVLIARPAKIAFTTADAAPVLVIDAVDELEWPRSNSSPTPKDLLDVIVDQAPQLHLKFVVTSRPEAGLWEAFGPPDSDSRRKHVRLHDIPRFVVDADVLRYLTVELKVIPASKDHISTLAARSQGLFIYAATACKHIKARNASPGTRLQALTSSHATALTGIDEMYNYILEEALQGLENSEVEVVLRCLHAIVCVPNPFSVLEFAHLLRLTPDQVRYALVALHSVINVPDPDDDHGFLTTYHASFPDYLTTRTRSGSKRWAADTGATHLDVFLGCNKIMETGLFFNVSGCSTSYASNAKQPSRHALPSYLAIVYACRFWIEHLTMSSISEERATQDVSAFFGKQFLYWLEVLSICNHADVASSLVKRLEVWLRDKQTTRSTENADVSRCLRLLLDAYDFLIRFRTPIVNSAPHIYISALAFTPPESEIGQAYLGLLERGLKVDTAERLTPLPLLKIHEHSRESSRRAIAFSADSSWIVSAADDGVRRWDARTGESIGQPRQGPDVPHPLLALSPDGSHAVSWDAWYSSAVHIWDTTLDRPNGRSLKVPMDATSDSVVLVFSPDGKCVAAGITMPKGRDFAICKWDADTGDPIGQLLELAGSACDHKFESIAFAPNGKRIFAVFEWIEKTGLWDAETGAEIAAPSDSSAATFSPDSAFVVYGEVRGAIDVRDAETGDAIGQPIQGHTEGVLSLAFSPNGKFIASGSEDTTVRVWSFEHGRLAGHRVLKGHTASVVSVVFSPDGRLLASTSENGEICIWDAAQTTTGHTNSFGERPGHTGGVRSVAFSPDGRQLASASRDGTVRVWDAHTGAAIGEPLLGLGHDCGCWPIAIAFLVNDNKINLVSCSNWPHSKDYDGHRGPAINVWDMETSNSGERPHNGYWGKDGTRACALSPDGKRIALESEGQEESSTEIIESAKGAHIVDLDMSSQADRSLSATVTFSLDGRFIAACFYDDTIRVWETDTGTRVAPPLEADKWRGDRVALSPDGKLLAYGSDYSVHVRIWNLETHIEQSGIEDAGTVASLAFSPDGKHLASASYDGTVRVWDAQTGALVLPPLTGHTDTVWSVAFSPDARHIATCSDDDTIRIWDVTVGASHAPVIVTGSGSPSLVDLWESRGAKFDMTEDGWIVGPHKELFLWIPPDYRTGLVWRRMTAIIIGIHSVRLDLRDFAHGSTWTECWGSA
ncbi:uncharacterized protein C8Q71DRAFT_132694 [Rhodofomes roseus]|uniref:Nephrocystin 3-like N-terminal domain-containing protein n=1 Tax=Rhodofomes roseus TaxID=34475 RepID=A0ABQ8KBK3_9APHY|nr:uncharacterized protein C8Q71DRAFT_132694 [Rhodofomes roseus]KAH9834936.1 hypothetical protein C8Q71DRAFT_132694 [Rhodofomes roseus]